MRCDQHSPAEYDEEEQVTSRAAKGEEIVMVVDAAAAVRRQAETMPSDRDHAPRPWRVSQVPFETTPSLAASLPRSLKCLSCHRKTQMP